jgi:hypothetical protein
LLVALGVLEHQHRQGREDRTHPEAGEAPAEDADDDRDVVVQGQGRGDDAEEDRDHARLQEDRVRERLVRAAAVPRGGGPAQCTDGQHQACRRRGQAAFAGEHQREEDLGTESGRADQASERDD